MKPKPNKLPRNGPEREALREKGQFWTPDWVAEAMVAYAVGGGADHVFDPAVGAGAFFRAAKTIANQIGQELALLGTEIDGEILLEAEAHGLSPSDLSRVKITDFVLNPPTRAFNAIVANPPYIRHHRLPVGLKEKLKSFGASKIGRPLDGRAGFHIYFLLRALELLAPGGRLAFIMPADTCEGVFATTLWRWITKNYKLDAVVTFAPDASPFPDVDTNPLILMISSGKPGQRFFWAQCLKSETQDLRAWTVSGFRALGAGLHVCEREVTEGVKCGLSRPPATGDLHGPILGDFAGVLRGIATGANEFFFLTSEKAVTLRIPSEFLVPAVGRTRDVPEDHITIETLSLLEKRGRPTLLFSPDGRRIDLFPTEVREYLKHGEEMGLAEKPLIAQRRPWYKMEMRAAPPFLFAYLGRRNARFIRNLAGVVPLTGFLCVYPRWKDADHIEKLWKVLQHPETVANLRCVGKSYGSGAIKVEPRALERLPLPSSVLLEVGLMPLHRTDQLPLSYAS